MSPLRSARCDEIHMNRMTFHSHTGIVQACTGADISLAGDNVCRFALTRPRAVPIDAWGSDQFRTEQAVAGIEACDFPYT
jgi:hypothetical protein